jgi:NADH-quinone oxidoreductase subunit N
VLVFIALLNTVISLYYYLLVVKAMFIKSSDDTIETVKTDGYSKIGLTICLAGTILLGLVSCVYGYINGFGVGLY